MNPLTALHGRIWRLAWPLLLSNLATPLLGLVDTAVVGHLNSPVYLAAVALGSNFFMFLYFSFNFLRMGTTGLVAQAEGQAASSLDVLLRGLFLALLLGLALIAVGPWLRELGLWLLGGEAAVQQLAAAYIDVRLLGAPAALANFVLIGVAIGLERSRVALGMTLVMQVANMLLDVLLVQVWHFDVRGVAIASMTAAWLGCFAGLYWLRDCWFGQLRQRLRQKGLLAWQALLPLLTVNRDLFIRSLLLLSAFFFFTAQGARLGDTLLAANAVLITFMLILSSLLDGFANAAEALVGKALGQGRWNRLQGAVSATGIWAIAVALLVLLAFVIAGDDLIHLLTDLPEVRQQAIHYLPWMWLLTLTAAAGFWLDGVFVGLTDARGMRNVMVVAMLVFFAVWWASLSWKNHGLWLALNALMLTRSLGMGALWWRHRNSKLAQTGQ